MNIPYVKRYNEKGNLENPIEGRYISPYPSRKVRRMKDLPKRAGKLLITNLGRGKFVKYLTVLQVIPANKEFGHPKRTILHYKEV